MQACSDSFCMQLDNGKKEQLTLLASLVIDRIDFVFDGVCFAREDTKLKLF